MLITLEAINMLELEVIKNFLVAVALGILIGLEREYSQAKGHYKSFAGIRTFPLIALGGALVTYISILTTPWVLVIGIVILCGLIIAAYYSSSIKSKYHGITTAIAALLVFFMGSLCMYGKTNLAILIGIATAVFLYSRKFLHEFVKKMKKQELVDTLKFAVVAFVILPFLPNKGYGPYELFNPFIIWLMVVFVSGISFVGYILMKWFGERGIEMTGFFGGLVSSTAVTMDFADKSKREQNVRALVLGVILANTAMFISIIIKIIVVNASLLFEMILPLLILILVSAVFSYLLWRKLRETKTSKLKLDSPFTLKPALTFGVFFAVILALAKLANIYLSSKGVYLVSFISGFIGMDAITVSLAQLAKKSLAEDIARNGIIIATLTNIAVKGGIAYFFGSKKFGWIVLGLFAVLILVGLGIVFLI